MKKVLAGFVAFAMLQVVAYCQSTGPKVALAQSEISSAGSKLLNDKVQEWIRQNRLPGAIVSISKNGKVVYEKSFGYDNSEKKIPMRTDLLVRLASQTKAVTSVGIMILFEEGKLLLHDPVSKFLPEYKNIKVIDNFNATDTTYTTVDAKRQITIHDLLTHTSGIGYPLIGSSTANAVYAKHGIPAGLAMKEGVLLADAMQKLATLPLMHQPGERFTYGLNTDLLGYIIEVVSKSTLQDFFQTRIFAPLGMNDTYFYLPKEKQHRLATLHFEDASGIHPMTANFSFNGTNWDPHYPNTRGTYYSGGAGLTSTIKDYSTFLHMLMNEGTYNGKKILSPSSVKMMTSNQIGGLNIGVDKFGLAFSIASEKSAARLPVSVGTYGWGGAFGTAYWVDPKEKIVAQVYTQVWARRHNTEEAFKTVVYQAVNSK
jgi:CubicO group peptidase (beta-lactamase class C family)